MLVPHRESAELTDSLDLISLPNNKNWDGKIAYLDRDGVINIGSEHYVNSPSEVELLPGAGLAIGKLRRAGYRVVVVTNQSPTNHQEPRTRPLFESVAPEYVVYAILH